jgi:hypothetical protein
MYATLSLKRLISIIGYPLIFIFVGFVLLQGVPTSLLGVMKLAGGSIGLWAGVLVVLGGSSAAWSPWRIIWRMFPPLNNILFPDLNGVWTGSTQSNWSCIEAMLQAIDGKRDDISKETLDQIPLRKDAIEISIRASLFKFIVEAKLSSTGGVSHSVTETLLYDPRLERFELYYVYLQDTPTPRLTDDTSHQGAAHLLLDTKAWTLKGNYWTMRSWRAGLNTSGLLEVARS